MVTALAALTLIYGYLILRTVRAEHNHITEHLDRITHHLQEAINMSAQDIINTLVTQLDKAKGEIAAKIEDLQNQIDAGVPAEQLDLTALTEAAQGLDDVVPDAPVVPADVPADAPVDVPVDSPPF